MHRDIRLGVTFIPTRHSVFDPNRLHASYARTRGQFLTDRSESKSETLKVKYIEAAVFADAVMLALTRLPTCATNIAEWCTARTDRLLEHFRANTEQTKSSLITLAGLDREFSADARTLVVTSAIDVARTYEDLFTLQMAQGDFLDAVCQMWFESVESLFAPDPSEAFERIQMVMMFAAGKLPVVGHFLDFLKFAAELSAVRKSRQRAADQHLESIEKFVDACSIWLVGVFTFVAQTEKLDSLPVLVSNEEVMELVASHIQGVSSKHSNPSGK